MATSEASRGEPSELVFESHTLLGRLLMLLMLQLEPAPPPPTYLTAPTPIPSALSCPGSSAIENALLSSGGICVAPAVPGWSEQGITFTPPLPSTVSAREIPEISETSLSADFGIPMRARYCPLRLLPSSRWSPITARTAPPPRQPPHSSSPRACAAERTCAASAETGEAGGVTGGVKGGATFTGDVTEPCATPRAQLSALLTAAAAVASASAETREASAAAATPAAAPERVCGNGRMGRCARTHARTQGKERQPGVEDEKRGYKS